MGVCQVGHPADTGAEQVSVGRQRRCRRQLEQDFHRRQRLGIGHRRKIAPGLDRLLAQVAAQLVVLGPDFVCRRVSRPADPDAREKFQGDLDGLVVVSKGNENLAAQACHGGPLRCRFGSLLESRESPFGLGRAPCHELALGEVEGERKGEFAARTPAVLGQQRHP